MCLLFVRLRMLQSPLVEDLGTWLFKSAEVDKNVQGIGAMLGDILNTRQVLGYRMKWGKLNRLNLLSTLQKRGSNRVLWLSPKENLFGFHIEPSVEWNLGTEGVLPVTKKGSLKCSHMGTAE